MGNRRAFEQLWVSPAEAEELTGRSRWTWRRDAYEGKIASMKVGRLLKFRKEDVLSFMERNLRPALGAVDLRVSDKFFHI